MTTLLHEQGPRRSTDKLDRVASFRRVTAMIATSNAANWSGITSNDALADIDDGQEIDQRVDLELANVNPLHSSTLPRSATNQSPPTGKHIGKLFFGLFFYFFSLTNMLSPWLSAAPSDFFFFCLPLSHRHVQSCSLACCHLGAAAAWSLRITMSPRLVHALLGCYRLRTANSLVRLHSLPVCTIILHWHRLHRGIPVVGCLLHDLCRPRLRRPSSSQ